jgi:hypothetical protein
MNDMELVAKKEDIKNHINDNVNITQIKWDSLYNNLPISNEDFFIVSIWGGV